jgi:DNA-binding transcriptional MerR regulator/methylmalonyl-CoA mutase cobalamin-binding subunit
MSEALERESADGYSIRVAARLSGVSADKLRIWERRYGFPRPQRSGAGTRVYSEADVRRLSLIARALRIGYRVSDAIGTSSDELQRVLQQAARPLPTQERREPSPDVETLVQLVAIDDIPAVRRTLRQLGAALGGKRFVTDIAGPLTERTGEAWAAGEIDVRHEHLLSQLLSSQLRQLMNSEDQDGARVVVLSTLPGEHHGLGLEMAAAYLSAHGLNVRFLGTDTPVPDIVSTARASGAAAVGISVSLASETLQNERSLSALLEQLPASMPVWLGGAKASEVRLSDARLVRVPTFAALERVLAGV